MEDGQLFTDAAETGDTLYLRAGSYFENIYCALTGTEKSQITIRSYPGDEQS